MSISSRALISTFFAVLTALTLAQDGVSTAGIARTKYLGSLGMIPAAREVAVEDFVNYHRHEIGRPKAGESVALDLRWGNSSLNPSGFGILQVGISTSLVHDRKQLRPLNLSLVIDKSGSMSEDNKMVRVKAALETLVTQLRPTDTLSIVTFDDKAEVAFPSQLVGDGQRVRSVIREIQPGSMTNIDGGLMLGYEQALKSYSKGSTNRVVLLTDGIANRGVTDPAEIAKDSLKFNDRGIDLSTIGVGQDLNKDLLSTLAKSGHGLFHFVANSEDIQKVFANEVQSLLSPVATQPTLEIDYGPGVLLDKVYGFDPQPGQYKVKIDLDTINSGMTEVVLLRFKASRARTDGWDRPVKVRLSYYDLNGNKQVEKSESIALPLKEGKGVQDESVGKNYWIAVLAQSIHDMAALCEQHKYREAESLITTAIDGIERRYPNSEDADIKRILDIARKYEDVLGKRPKETETESDSVLPPTGNLIRNGDFSFGNTGFTSDLPYTTPRIDCLWPGGYTVSPQFNNPQLHTLVARQEFAAPKRSNGNEQMLFANAGGTDPLVVWSSEVTCAPNTNYRLSFQTISLTPGIEWIPTFEIRVDGERSEPQSAGDGVFKQVNMTWNSKKSTRVRVSIVRMTIPHGGGIIGIGNIEMVKARTIL